MTSSWLEREIACFQECSSGGLCPPFSSLSINPLLKSFSCAATAFKQSFAISAPSTFPQIQFAYRTPHLFVYSGQSGHLEMAAFLRQKFTQNSSILLNASAAFLCPKPLLKGAATLCRPNQSVAISATQSGIYGLQFMLRSPSKRVLTGFEAYFASAEPNATLSLAMLFRHCLFNTLLSVNPLHGHFSVRFDTGISDKFRVASQMIFNAHSRVSSCLYGICYTFDREKAVLANYSTVEGPSIQLLALARSNLQLAVALSLSSASLSLTLVQ